MQEFNERFQVDDFMILVELLNYIHPEIILMLCVITAVMG
jgi:hypothetical protein